MSLTEKIKQIARKYCVYIRKNKKQCEGYQKPSELWMERKGLCKFQYVGLCHNPNVHVGKFTEESTVSLSKVLKILSDYSIIEKQKLRELRTWLESLLVADQFSKSARLAKLNEKFVEAFGVKPTKKEMTK